jgi:protein-S-isoprenylcysteine O-methyltransferase Ste14
LKNVPHMPHGKHPFSGAGRRFAQLTSAIALWGLLLFVSAGNFTWVRGWVYLGLYALGLMICGGALIRFNPTLAAVRARTHHGTKPFDRTFAALYAPMLFVIAVVAGLDAVRFGWSILGTRWLCVGALLQIGGSIPIAWAMATNPFLETTVRIQTDRGQQVISSGPYRYVRHPMYVGAILQIIATPLILGSVWALLPTCLVIGLLMFRTYMEDRTLYAELPGYAAYTQHTRYRLIPRVW